jgi:RNA polymerase sigma-70 factor (ECF subfamily)
MDMPGEAVLSGPFPMADAAHGELEGIVVEHSRMVYRIAWSVLRNHHDAEDAAQETFVRYLRNRRLGGKIRDQRAWLAKAAWRVAIDFQRKSRRAGKLQDCGEIPLNEAPEVVARLRAAGVTAHDIAARREMESILTRLIKGLPPDLRDVLQLSLSEELTSSDIGCVLGIPEGSVRERLSRARQILRTKFSAVLEGKHAR